MHNADDAIEVAGKRGSLVNDAAGRKNFKDPATVTMADRVTEGIDETVSVGDVATDEFDKLTNLASPKAATAGAAKHYDPVITLLT